MKSPLARIVMSVAGIALVGGIDWVTGVELRVYPLYFLPLSLGAWSAGRRGALALAGLSTAVWAISNLAAGLDYSNTGVWISNVSMQLIGFGTVGLLIAELERRLSFEASLSRVDTLTGLANARAFRERAELVLSLSRRHPRPTTIAYVDLDNFKAVNDTRGHAEGDALLQTVARCLQASIRSTDVAARIGGDELAVILPESDEEASRQVIERFRSALATAMAKRGWPVTASVGAVTILGVAPPLDEVLGLADAVMYRAKRGGKNLVYVETVPSALA